MKLNRDFIPYTIDKENILVCLDSKKFAGVIKLNGTAAFLVEQLKTEQDRESLLAALQARFFGADEPTMRSDLETALSQLRSVGAVDE